MYGASDLTAKFYNSQGPLETLMWAATGLVVVAGLAYTARAIMSKKPKAE